MHLFVRFDVSVGPDLADVMIVHCSLHGFSSAGPVLLAVRLYEAKRLWFSLKAAQIYRFLSVHRLCSTKLEPTLVRLSRNWTTWCQQRYVLYSAHPPSYSLSDLELLSRAIDPFVILILPS